MLPSLVRLLPPLRFTYVRFAISMAWMSIVWLATETHSNRLIASDTAAEDVTFETHASPFLARHCVSCHQGSGAEGGLDLSSRTGWLQGGDSGLVMQPMDAATSDSERARVEASILGSRLLSGEMPPESIDHRPSDQETERFLQWMAAGASWPEGAIVDEYAVSTDSRAGRDWWSLQPLQQSRLPVQEPSHRARIENSIDAWLETSRLQHSTVANPRADRRTLLIRGSIDLLGLAPDLDQIERFERDDRPDAWARELDRMLASPHFGPRWGRHWLDVARYGDTHGYERDFPRTHAWRYRDWVIDSFNSDLPYDDFVRWQVAGDVLEPDRSEAIVATSFLAAGPYDVTGLAETPNPVLKRMARADELDDMVGTTVNAFLGLTIHCARCHSHKVDPISQQDYYRFAALLSGVHRGDMSILPAAQKKQRETLRSSLQSQLAALQDELRVLDEHIDLAAVVGGGTGRERREIQTGVDPRTGRFEYEQVSMLEGVETNQYVRGISRFIDGLSVPDGGNSADGTIVISSTGLRATVPDTTGASWDYLQNGPVHSQAHTTASDVDYAAVGHTMLGMHANKLVTFDLAALRDKDTRPWKLIACAAYGGREPQTRATVRILVDGQERFAIDSLTRESGAIDIEIELPADATFLTLIATDGGDGIGHDQVFFGDPRLIPSEAGNSRQTDEAKARLNAQIESLRAELESTADLPWTYGLVLQPPQPMQVQLRGDPEQTGDRVEPGFLTCLPQSQFGLSDETTDAERRAALAAWLTVDSQDLLARVIVNRLWQHHFGRGIVSTASDFGFNGEPPAHPELLDALASELITADWSLKWLHRKMLLSDAWQLSAADNESNRARDSDNRQLWRFEPRRLEAEAIRDRVLQASGTLNWQMHGPGFRDFEFEDRYAPIYRHRVTDSAEYRRRSIYRFAVRSVPDPLMDSLDCPNPSTAAPLRNPTTTAVQALALLNGPLTLQQSTRFAERLELELPNDRSAQVRGAFEAALSRRPDEFEQAWGERLVEQSGLRTLCRALLNCNEFLYWE